MGKHSITKIDPDKTELNSQNPHLLAMPGQLLKTADDGDAPASLEGMMQVFPIDLHYKKLKWDPRTGKIIEDTFHMSREYLQQMMDNTRELWSDMFPARRDHHNHGPASGWFDPETMVLNDTGLWIKVGWNAQLLKEISDDLWRYQSASWWPDYYDPQRKKKIGPLLLEISVTNVPYFKRQSGIAASDEQEIVAVTPVDAADINKQSKENNQMTKEQLALLGLEATASDEEGLAAMTTMKAAADENAAVREKLPIEDGESATDAVTELMEAPAPDSESTPDADKDKPDAAAPAQAAEETPVKEIGKELATGVMGIGIASKRIAPNDERIAEMTGMLSHCETVESATKMLDMMSPKLTSEQLKNQLPDEAGVCSVSAEVLEMTGVDPATVIKFEEAKS